ncbi:hypothetical protein GIB67_027961 [Kingdonia uniflora]|uniref:HMA domain-containing protein n=1 Tax=Kingdonia uniflora TaxID=39325 RepID=A0A7J7LGN5_9MAGN|nr:hypothetical protein GIB67_027961 [Kingdonia uniflora]
MAGSDQKSYFDVLGLCCSSEVPLIEGILKPLEGIKEVNVIVASRTVIVVHDNGVISENQIVKALNKARLEANVRVTVKRNTGIHGQVRIQWFAVGGTIAMKDYLEAGTIVFLFSIAERDYGEIDGKQIYVGNKRIAIRAGCGTDKTCNRCSPCRTLPEEKVKIIKELKIVGHYSDDGDGSALATETGDITLMSNDVRKRRRQLD